MDLGHRAALRLRMAVALCLALVGYAALFGIVWSLLPWPVSGVVVVGLASIVVLLVRNADRLVYLVTKAVSISRDDHPHLWDTVQRLAAQADVARPPVAVIPTDEPNALSAGTGSRGVVCVTLGLLKELDDDELEAVLAHEVAHLQNGDTTIMTVAAFPTTVATWLLSAARRVSRSWWLLLFWTLPLFLVFVGLPLLLASLPGTLVLARQREYAADRATVALTGDAYGLASALATLHDCRARPEEDLRLAAGLNAFCIVPPTGAFGLPWSHPPTVERVRRLKAISRSLE